MLNSKIGICNLALAAIGEDAIRDFDEGNKRARMCDRFYEATRDYILAQFSWPFAARRQALQQLAEASNWIPENTFPYALPSDCHQPLDLYPEGNSGSWEVMGREFYCYLDNKIEDLEVILSYTGYEIDPTKFSAQFVNLLSVALAVRIAPAITQDKELTKTIFQQYEIEKKEAWGTDAMIGNKMLHNDDNPRLDPFVDPDISFTGGNW